MERALKRSEIDSAFTTGPTADNPLRDVLVYVASKTSRCRRVRGQPLRRDLDQRWLRLDQARLLNPRQAPVGQRDDVRGRARLRAAGAEVAALHGAEWQAACEGANPSPTIFPYGAAYAAGSCNGADYQMGKGLTPSTTPHRQRRACVSTFSSTAKLFDMSGNVKLGGHRPTSMKPASNPTCTTPPAGSRCGAAPTTSRASRSTGRPAHQACSATPRVGALFDHHQRRNDHHPGDRRPPALGRLPLLPPGDVVAMTHQQTGTLEGFLEPPRRLRWAKPSSVNASFVTAAAPCRAWLCSA